MLHNCMKRDVAQHATEIATLSEMLPSTGLVRRAVWCCVELRLDNATAEHTVLQRVFSNICGMVFTNLTVVRFLQFWTGFEGNK